MTSMATMWEKDSLTYFCLLVKHHVFFVFIFFSCQGLHVTLLKWMGEMFYSRINYCVGPIVFYLSALAGMIVSNYCIEFQFLLVLDLFISLNNHD